MSKKTARMLRILLLYPAAMVVMAGIVFKAADEGAFYLEKDNSFCIACHLHKEKYKRFKATDGNPQDLAGRHHNSKNVRCIDCHKGEGILERAGVLFIAGFDTLLFFTGNYEEPEKMSFVLSDTSCIRCHKKDLVPEGFYADDYHSRPAHSRLPFSCKSCHKIHIPADRQQKYLISEIVIPICKECHPKMF